MADPEMESHESVGSEYPGPHTPAEALAHRAGMGGSQYNRSDTMIVKGRTQNARDQMDYRQSNQKTYRQYNK